MQHYGPPPPPPQQYYYGPPPPPPPPQQYYIGPPLPPPQNPTVGDYIRRWNNEPLNQAIVQNQQVVCNITRDEFLHITRGLLKTVQSRWRSNHAIIFPDGGLGVEDVEVQDNAVLIPKKVDGYYRYYSGDYPGETRRLVVAIFGPHPNCSVQIAWQERDNFLWKLGHCVDLTQFERLYFHPFLKNAEQRTLFFLHFCEYYRDREIPDANGMGVHWTKVYDDWEQWTYPNNRINLQSVCSLNPHAAEVHRFSSASYHKWRRGGKIILARNIIPHINGHSMNSNVPVFHNMEEMLSVIEYLFPNIGQHVWEFCCDKNLNLDIQRSLNSSVPPPRWVHQ